MFYNLGNNHPVELMQFIRTIEQAVGKEAELIFEDAQPGDVTRTYADISESKRDLGFDPHTSIEEGIARFVAWYKTYYQ
jgi:UDP-glucuronate 4-epimerase